jgi:protein-arginine kinase activator protein McsA
VFERFTERARQVVVLAQDEARLLKHNYIGTEHILLGLLREEEGLAARVLESLDINIEGVRAQVVRFVGQGDEVATGQIPFTPRAKKVLELALREGLALGHNYIGTEHILLGLVRENEGVAARILLDFDADAEKIRNEIIRMLSGAGRGEQGPLPTSPPVAVEVIAELERLRQEKLAAIDAGRFEEAAGLRNRERVLGSAAQALEVAWRARAAETAAGEPRPYEPATPPVASEVVEEIELIRRQKEEAIEAKDFERALVARDRERTLLAAARGLERAWKAPVPTPSPPSPTVSPSGRVVAFGGRHSFGSMPRRVAAYGPPPTRTSSALQLVLGWLLFAVALGVGILVGWAIWGL